MEPIPRERALSLLSECTGDEIWSIDHCRLRRVPESWIQQLSDTYESGFKSDRQTIYTDDGVTNQYHGVRDVDLAIALARSLGIKVDDQSIAPYDRARLVQAIKEAIMNGDEVL